MNKMNNINNMNNNMAYMCNMNYMNIKMNNNMNNNMNCNMQNMNNNFNNFNMNCNMQNMNNNFNNFNMNHNIQNMNNNMNNLNNLDFKRNINNIDYMSNNNLQLNIQNIQMIKNQVSLLNNTKRNSVIEALNKTMNITPKPNNDSDPEKEITIRCFLPNGAEIPTKAKLKEKFNEFIKKFCDNKCPEDYKNSLNYAVHNSDTYDIKKEEKTLFELGFQDRDPLLFLSLMELTKTDRLTKAESAPLLSDDEFKELIKKWLIEYQLNKLTDYLKKLIDLEENEDPPSFDAKIDISDFEKFVEEKSSKLGIEAEEHKHKLVYCLTNNNWICNECKQRYDKSEGKYFCSLCSYNMCDNCIQNKKYFKIKSFPKNVVPSNKNVKNNIEESSHHEHKLVYCRTIRSCRSCGWTCNVCKKGYGIEDWSFYCTLCDFDQCPKCFGIN